MNIIFYLLSIIALLGGLGVVLFQQPLQSALSLIVTMISLAGLFASLDAHFLAAAQIIVYAGAIMVLVVFVIMLLSLHAAERKAPNPFWMLGAILLGLAFLSVIVPELKESFAIAKSSALEGTVQSFGLILFDRYAFPFEAASVLIMTAIVGAVMLGKRSQRGK